MFPPDLGDGDGSGRAGDELDGDVGRAHAVVRVEVGAHPRVLHTLPQALKLVKHYVNLELFILIVTANNGAFPIRGAVPNKLTSLAEISAKTPRHKRTYEQEICPPP